MLEDRHLSMSGELKASLDAPFQGVIRVLEEMDEIRERRAKFLNELADKTGANANELAMGTEPDFIAGFTFTLAVRNLRGQIIDQHESHIRFGLDTEPGMFLVERDITTVRQASFASLKKPDGFRILLDWMVSPGSLHLKKPADSS